MEPRNAMLTPEQVAEYLQLDRETIYRYIRSGKLGAAKFGRAYRVSESDVATLVEQNRVVPASEPRIYTDEEIAAILEADKIDDATREAFKQYVAQFE